MVLLNLLEFLVIFFSLKGCREPKKVEKHWHRGKNFFMCYKFSNLTARIRKRVKTNFGKIGSRRKSFFFVNGAKTNNSISLLAPCCHTVKC